MAPNQLDSASQNLRTRLEWFEGARGGEGNIAKPEFDDAGNPLNDTARTIVDLRARITGLGLD